MGTRARLASNEKDWEWTEDLECLELGRSV